MHSARSDGTESPAAVVRAAVEHGLRTFSLTDHDTTAGWAEASAAARVEGVTFLPGMELSTRHRGRSIHMLAYLFDPAEPELLAELRRIREDRLGRAERIVRNIAVDHTLTWEDVLAQRAEDASIGRPHIADALIARGIVRDRDEAFAGILHPRTGYIVPLYAPDPFHAVSLVRAAGGVPIMAHPAGRGDLLPLATLESLVDAGLAGFEVGHRENTEAGKRVLRDLAQRRDLIVTGSSDYHGAGKPNRPGENTTSDEAVTRIIAEGTGVAPVYPA